MEPHEVRELIELISRSNFREFELERNGFRIKLIKTESGAASVAPAVQLSSPPAVDVRPQVETGAQAVAAEPEDGLYELNSPIVGTFYRSASPDKPPFVDVGQRVNKGQVVCIVEAMKVMNEIESDVDGEVVDITVANAQPVEYGEILLRIRPS